MTDVSESYLESLRDRAEFAEETLTAEQREHDITRRQLDTARDMHLNKKVGNCDNACDVVASMHKTIEGLRHDVDIQKKRADMYRDDLNEERRLNNAALKPSAKVLQQDQDDEMACMAEEVMSLKSKLKRSHELAESVADTNGGLTQKIEALELVEVALRTEVSKLAGYKVELESSAETQAQFIQQVDAACKAAEAKVQEQRKEIETLKCDEDLWICPSVDDCTRENTGDHACQHTTPHAHKWGCTTPCTDAGESVKCVKVNPCKECAKMREEIINRDAVIVQYESRAEDREEIIKALAKEIKVIAPTTGTYTIMFAGKREDMPNIELNKCRHFNVCDYAKRENNTCANGGGEYCGVWRHKEDRR